MDTHPRFIKLVLCSWHTLPLPSMMQLVQSLHASSLYLTRVLLARTTCATDDTACAIYERLGPLFDPGSPGRHDCAADAAACAVSERLGPLLDPGSLARCELCRRCCGWCSFKLDKIIFSTPRQCTAAVAPQTIPPVLEMSKRKITRPDDIRVSTRRCNNSRSCLLRVDRLIEDE